ncbi:MAG: insulinase family protein [Candidatus Nanopelagicales bacterium]|nr:insulinase family protein [Candidatus Nanopelagicales bacterium]
MSARNSAVVLGHEQRPGTTRTLLTAEQGGLVKRTVLPGGLRIITEQMPSVRSAAIGIWVNVGSRDEVASQTGSAHYLEHLLFKGTKNRTALDISSTIDAVGGEMNAFTSKEVTCFYTRVLDTSVPEAIEVLVDMITSATITSVDVDQERQVVLEEIAMRDDDPADIVHEQFSRALYGDAPLGRSILGTVENISSLSRRSIHGFYRKYYTPDRLVVAVAGNIDHASIVKQIRKAFNLGGFDLGGEETPYVPSKVKTKVSHSGGFVKFDKTTEQANLVIGVPGLDRADERRYIQSVFNAALGGGMSSRLFQEVREKRGLVYTVYSFGQQFQDAGMAGVYAGCSPKNLEQVTQVITDVLDEVALNGITEAELVKAKGQVSGGMVLGLEDTSSRMSRIARSEMNHGYVPSVSQVLERISAVTLEEVHTLAHHLWSQERLTAVVGPE